MENNKRVQYNKCITVLVLQKQERAHDKLGDVIS